MNQKGFGLTELLAFISASLIILVMAVIFFNENFGKIEQVETDNTFKPAEMIGTSNNVVEIKENEIEEETQNDDEIEENKIDKKYKELLDKMATTAKLYVLDNYTGKTEQLVIKLTELIEKEYMEELVDPNDKEIKCNGYVIYDGDSTYDSYLKCQDNFESENYNMEFE